MTDRNALISIPSLHEECVSDMGTPVKQLVKWQDQLQPAPTLM